MKGGGEESVRRPDAFYSAKLQNSSGAGECFVSPPDHLRARVSERQPSPHRHERRRNMPKQSRRATQGGNGNGASGHDVLAGGGAEPGTTGRFLVLLKEDAIAEGVRILSEKVGLRVARSADFVSAPVSAELSGADSVVFDEIGVAVVHGEPDQHRALVAVAEDSAV